MMHCRSGRHWPLINQTLDEVLAEQEGDFDADTRWALAGSSSRALQRATSAWRRPSPRPRTPASQAWWTRGYSAPERARSACSGLKSCPDDWDPEREQRLTVWEAVHHLVRVLDEGETAAAGVVAKLGYSAETARELAYRLYRICDQKNRTQEALGYNSLVQSWPEIARLAQQVARPQQGTMFR